MKKRFKDKVVIITGAASGMGREQARMFAAEGASLVLTDISDVAGADLAELGDRLLILRHDIGSEEDWRAVVKAAERRFGRIDILVNNAGILVDSPLLELEVADLRRHLDINLVGTFIGMRSVAPVMMRQGAGVIVNMSSVSGMMGHPKRGAYATSKWAIRGLSKTAALEWAPAIRVCVVCPGPIDTPMSRKARGLEGDHSLAATALPNLPLQRFGRAEEVAAAILFVASDDAAYMTGNEIVIDGGCLLKH